EFVLLFFGMAKFFCIGGSTIVDFDQKRKTQVTNLCFYFLEWRNFFV
mgnify:CR=1